MLAHHVEAKRLIGAHVQDPQPDGIAHLGLDGVDVVLAGVVIKGHEVEVAIGHALGVGAGLFLTEEYIVGDEVVLGIYVLEIWWIDDDVTGHAVGDVQGHRGG